MVATRLRTRRIANPSSFARSGTLALNCFGDRQPLVIFALLREVRDRPCAARAASLLLARSADYVAAQLQVPHQRIGARARRRGDRVARALTSSSVTRGFV